MTLQLVGTYEETDLGDLAVRVAPLEPCQQPLCQCQRETNYMLAFGDPDAEDRWLFAQTNYESEVGEILELLEPQPTGWLLAMTILFGGNWERLAGDPVKAMQRQQEACVMMPTRYLTMDPAGLRRFRGALNVADPVQVARFCILTEQFGFDPIDSGGGYYPGAKLRDS